MNQPAQWRIWTEPLSCKITRFYNNEMQSATGTLPSVVVGLRKKKEKRTELKWSEMNSYACLRSRRVNYPCLPSHSAP